MPVMPSATPMIWPKIDPNPISCSCLVGPPGIAPGEEGTAGLEASGTKGATGGFRVGRSSVSSIGVGSLGKSKILVTVGGLGRVITGAATLGMNRLKDSALRKDCLVATQVPPEARRNTPRNPFNGIGLHIVWHGRHPFVSAARCIVERK